MRKSMYMWISEKEIFCRVRNAERCAKERGMRKQNGCGDMEIVCFIHVMYIVDDHG